MMAFTDYLIVIAFIVEVVFLAIVEKRMWNTIYTPLNILMLPAAAIMLLVILCVPIFKLYPFYYPSLLIWEVGLLLFFIPSCICNFFVDKKTSVTAIPMPVLPNKWLIFSVTVFLLLVYAGHLYSSLNATIAAFGSDEFAEEASSSGPWAHVLVLLFTIEILCFCYISRKNWYFIVLILLIVVASVLNMVKGWVIIPLLAGVLLNIYVGRLRVTLRLILIVVLGGAGFFFLSYYLSLVFSTNKDFTDEVLFFIVKNFFHYLSSGFLGLSMDCDRGILENQSVEYLFTPFANVYHYFTDGKLLSSLNKFYLFTTWSGFANNVRSFMGTVYVYGGAVYGALVVLLYSSVAYLIRVMLLRKQTFFWLLTDAWMSSFLFMGWFDYYFALLKPFEAVVFFFLIYKGIQFFTLRKDSVQLCS
ncbi:MAG: hypothetical protein J6T38_08350 [Bacteroidaceae bacterium]|nr:hypothetical protein [Bacteroidaceae bacterium]